MIQEFCENTIKRYEFETLQKFILTQKTDSHIGINTPIQTEHTHRDRIHTETNTLHKTQKTRTHSHTLSPRTRKKTG